VLFRVTRVDRCLVQENQTIHEVTRTNTKR
jgi:hypothetical protein